MSFLSVNEVDKFSYEDCISLKMENSDGLIRLELEALIVKATNSANSNYTDSYADVAVMNFKDSSICKVVLEGYKYYSANDVLIEAVPDRELDINEENWTVKFSKVFLINVEKKEENKFILEFEMPDDDPSARTDVYEMTIEAKEVSVRWDKYMNRVQK